MSDIGDIFNTNAAAVSFSTLGALPASQRLNAGLRSMLVERFPTLWGEGGRADLPLLGALSEAQAMLFLRHLGGPLAARFVRHDGAAFGGHEVQRECFVQTAHFALNMLALSAGDVLRDLGATGRGAFEQHLDAAGAARMRVMSPIRIGAWRGRDENAEVVAVRVEFLALFEPCEARSLAELRASL